MQFTITHKELHKALTLTAFAQGKESIRYFLNGVHLTTEGGKLTLVATDGHRLSRYVTECEAGELPPHVIIPRETVDKLLKAKPVGNTLAIVTINDTSATFDLGGQTLTTKLIDGNFPDYARVIPDLKREDSGAPQCNALYVADLAKALKAATGDKAPFVRLRSCEQDPIICETEVEGFTHIIMPKWGK